MEVNENWNSVVTNILQNVFMFHKRKVLQVWNHFGVNYLLKILK